MVMKPISYVEMGTGRWRQQPENAQRLLVVIHDSEQAEDLDQTDDADQLMRALSRPGIAGYHAVTDCWPLGYHQIAPWHARVNGAPPMNEEALHICMPERIGYTAEQWIASGHVHAVASFLRDVRETYAIPFRRLQVGEMKADANGKYIGPMGYCSHYDVTRAFGKTTHTDPGPNFPWSFLASLLTPPEPQPTPPTIIDSEDEDVEPEVWISNDAAQTASILYVGGGKCYEFASVSARDALLDSTKTVPPFKPRRVPIGMINAVYPKGNLGKVT